MIRTIADQGKGYYHIVTGKIPHEAKMYAASRENEYLLYYIMK